MKKLSKHICLSVFVAITLLTACSDDEKNHSQSISFTPDTELVKVVPYSGTMPQNSYTSGYALTFTALDDWRINITPITSSSDPVDWITISNNSGGKGSQTVEVLVSPNTGSKDRMAMIEVSCKGETCAISLVQQAEVIAANSNAGAIDPSKMITSIEQDNLYDKYKITFGYDINGVLTTMEQQISRYQGEMQEDNVEKIRFNISSDTRISSTGVVGISKVSYEINRTIRGIEQSKRGVAAIANGMTVAGILTSSDGSGFDQQSFSYNGENIKAIECNNYKYMFDWNRGNIIATVSDPGCNPFLMEMSYGEKPNDTNLDLGLIMLLIDATPIELPAQLLGIMNLLGKRSINLPATINDQRLSYSDGVITPEGVKPGLTISAFSKDAKADTEVNYVIKVLFKTTD